MEAQDHMNGGANASVMLLTFDSFSFIVIPAGAKRRAGIQGFQALHSPWMPAPRLRGDKLRGHDE